MTLKTILFQNTQNYNSSFSRDIPPVAPRCSTRDPGGRIESRSKRWRWVGLGVGLGIRGQRWVGSDICKVGGVRSGSPPGFRVLQ